MLTAGKRVVGAVRRVPQLLHPVWHLRGASGQRRGGILGDIEQEKWMEVPVGFRYGESAWPVWTVGQRSRFWTRALSLARGGGRGAQDGVGRMR